MSLRLGLVILAAVAALTWTEAPAAMQQPSDARDALMYPGTVARILGRAYDGSSAGEERLGARAPMFRGCEGGLAGSLQWLTSVAWGTLVETSTTSHRAGRVAGLLSVAARLRRAPRRDPIASASRALRRCGVRGRSTAFRDRGRRTRMIQFTAKPAFGDERLEWRLAVVRSGRSIVVVMTGLVAPARCTLRCADRRLLRGALRRARRVLKGGIRRPSARPRIGPTICRRGRCRTPVPPGAPARVNPEDGPVLSRPAAAVD